MLVVVNERIEYYVEKVEYFQVPEFQPLYLQSVCKEISVGGQLCGSRFL